MGTAAYSVWAALYLELQILSQSSELSRGCEMTLGRRQGVGWVRDS